MPRPAVVDGTYPVRPEDFAVDANALKERHGRVSTNKFRKIVRGPLGHGKRDAQRKSGPEAAFLSWCGRLVPAAPGHQRKSGPKAAFLSSSLSDLATVTTA